jgi:hypothetical protein
VRRASAGRRRPCSASLAHAGRFYAWQASPALASSPGEGLRAP